MGQATSDVQQRLSKVSLEEQFEHRWRKAYEVRALERECRTPKAHGSQTNTSQTTQEPSQHAGKTTVSVAAAAGAGATATLKAGSSDGVAVVTASGTQPASTIRRQEVQDDDEVEAVQGQAGGPGQLEDKPTADATSTQEQAVASQPSSSGSGRGSGNGGDDSEGEPALRVVWDSGSSRRAAAVQLDIAPEGSPAATFKAAGNLALKEGRAADALEAYTRALQAWGSEQQKQQQSGQQQTEAAAVAQQLHAALLSNRAQALLKLGRFSEAAGDAQRAHQLLPAWPKPLYRLAQAQRGLCQWAAAVAAARAGEKLVPVDSSGHTEFTPLLDGIAVDAALAGSSAGFDGLQLEVRSAGDDAWLGGPAPHVPELDGPLDEDGAPATAPAAPLLPSTAEPCGASSSNSSGTKASLQLAAAMAAGSLSSNSSSSGRGALASWDYKSVAAAAALERRRTSFRSLREAVAAARDGDRILLRRGVHNGMGEACTIDKRLLIEGEGGLGETVLDQRANCPSLRITRGGVVVRGLELDHTGFREALLVAGGACVAPLLEGCTIKCSGDDAVNVSGVATPTLRRCVVTGKKCGVRAFGTSRPRLEECVVEVCGEQGVKAQEGAAPLLLRCTVSGCSEEATLAMDTAHLMLQHCVLKDCKAPALDISGTAQATVTGGSMQGCMGGVWLWGSGRASLAGVRLDGGPSHAILADGSAMPDLQDCKVHGSVHATDAAWGGIARESNQLEGPDGPTDLPPEEGAFRFVPSPFTHKQ